MATMMHCTNCGMPFNPGQAICNGCGIRLVQPVVTVQMDAPTSSDDVTVEAAAQIDPSAPMPLRPVPPPFAPSPVPMPVYADMDAPTEMEPPVPTPAPVPLAKPFVSAPIPAAPVVSAPVPVAPVGKPWTCLCGHVNAEENNFCEACRKRKKDAIEGASAPAGKPSKKYHPSLRPATDSDLIRG